jgi:hypothetical protein
LRHPFVPVAAVVAQLEQLVVGKVKGQPLKRSVWVMAYITMYPV